MEENKNQCMYMVEDSRNYKYYCVKSIAEAYALAVKLYGEAIDPSNPEWDVHIIKEDLTTLFDVNYIEDIVYITKAEVMNMEDID